jgi:uncharacterized protein (TIRG00374 family)
MRPERVAAIVIGLAIAAAVIWFSHPADVWESAQEVQLLPLLGALLVNIPVVALRAVRAQVILNFLGYKVPFWTMVPVQLVGQTSSSITPAASGDYVRAYLWRRGQEIPLPAGAAVVTFERVYSLFLLVAVAVLLIALPRHGSIGWIGVAAGLAAATLAPFILELATPPALEAGILNRVATGRVLARFGEAAAQTVESLRRLLRSPVVLVETSAITLVVFVFSGLQVALLLSGLGDSVRITQAVAVYATSQVAGILSTLPFGLGASDAILVAVLAGYGVAAADAATTALLFRAVSTVPQALAGLVAYLRFDHGVAPEPIGVAADRVTK